MLFAILLKAEKVFRINCIPKKMVQICYLRLKLGSEAVSCCLLLRMVSIDMD